MAETQALFRHILVPADGSQPSVAAGRLAVQLAAVHRARITFVYVVDSSAIGEMTGTLRKTAQQVQHELELAGQRCLNHLACLAANADLTADQVIRYGTPYSEVERLAREEQVDLIVIGQVGHRGPRRILIGSVTERLIECAPCPVLVVK
jgi:nucleotide-binding universal stress UspA family protein